MKLLRLAPAKFIHFGTTREILELMSGGVDEYRELGWSRLIGSSIKDSDTAGYNSVLSSRADISKDCYLEVSYVHGEAKVDNIVCWYVIYGMRIAKTEEKEHEGESTMFRILHGKHVRELEKSSLFYTKYQDQTEVSGVILWMTGSMAKPCISQWNCSADKDLSSVEERGHVK